LKQIKKLAGETMLYGLGSIVPRFLNFLLFPLHTRIFAPEEYGVFTYLMSFVALLNVVFTFGMETAFFRFANRPGADPTRIFNVAQTWVMIISTGLSLVFIAFAAGISSMLGSTGHADFIVWLSAILWIDNIVAIPFARLRLQQKPLQFALYKISNVVILTGLNLYFLLVAFDAEVGIGYVFLANLIANAFYLLFFLKTLVRWRPAFDSAFLKPMLTYGYPIMLTGIAGMMNEFFSRILLQHWLPANFYPGRSAEFAVGVFGSAYRFAVFMSLAVQAFRMAAEPFFFSQAGNKNSPQLFAKVNHYFIITGCFILLLVGINLDVLKLLLLKNADYWVSLPVVPILLLGYLLLGVYYNLSVWFKLTDRPQVGTVITVGAAVATIVLNYFIIPVAGYEGSSWITVAVYGSMAVVCYVLGQKYYPIPYRAASGLLYILVTYVLVVTVNTITFSSQVMATTFHLLTLAGFVALIFLIEKKHWQQGVD
jgi:O-antigen/teichoic acid export membrane protein